MRNLIAKLRLTVPTRSMLAAIVAAAALGGAAYTTVETLAPVRTAPVVTFTCADQESGLQRAQQEDEYRANDGACIHVDVIGQSYLPDPTPGEPDVLICTADSVGTWDGCYRYDADARLYRAERHDGGRPAVDVEP